MTTTSKPKIDGTWEGTQGYFELYYRPPEPYVDSERDTAASVIPNASDEGGGLVWTCWNPEWPGPGEAPDSYQADFAWGVAPTLELAQAEAEAVLRAAGYEIVYPVPELPPYWVLLLDAKRNEWSDYLDHEDKATVPKLFRACDPAEAVRKAFRDLDDFGEPLPRKHPARAEVVDMDGKLTRWLYEPTLSVTGVPLMEPTHAEELPYRVRLHDAEDHHWHGWYDDCDEDGNPAGESCWQEFRAKSHHGAVWQAVTEAFGDELGLTWDDEYVFEVQAPGCLPLLLTVEASDIVRPAEALPGVEFGPRRTAEREPAE